MELPEPVKVFPATVIVQLTGPRPRRKASGKFGLLPAGEIDGR